MQGKFEDHLHQIKNVIPRCREKIADELIAAQRFARYEELEKG
jgi:hypothetical protein